MINGPSFLVHYASPYYDPEKAHEYYEEHKKLKGRREGTLNEEGVKAKMYVHKQIMDEKQSNLDFEKEYTKNQLDSVNDKFDTILASKKADRDRKVEEYKYEMTWKIESLKKQLERMSKEEKSNKKDAIKAQIAELREDNKNKRAEAVNAYKTEAAGNRSSKKQITTGIREDSKNTKQYIRDYAKNRYEQELDDIYADEKFTKPKKK